ncbi:MAG: hypothetical protein K8H88_03860, partial [Sandaracinaceae bacterium]|nr:hypothetical protein [Sandaracinaceae bacterium]
PDVQAENAEVSRARRMVQSGEIVFNRGIWSPVSVYESRPAQPGPDDPGFREYQRGLSEGLAEARELMPMTAWRAAIARLERELRQPRYAGVGTGTLSNAQQGALGEHLAEWLVRDAGFTNVVQIQNSSNHGIDFAAEFNGRVVHLEVKTSRSGSVRLSSDQRNANTFVMTRLTRMASDPTVDPMVRVRAQALRIQLVQAGGQVNGAIVAFTRVTSADGRMTIFEWTSQGRGQRLESQQLRTLRRLSVQTARRMVRETP